MIRNIGLLEETGKKDVCVITWQLNEGKKNEELRRALEERGFRVRFAGRMHGLMRRFVRLKLSARLTKRQYCTQLLKYLLLAAERMLQPGCPGREPETLYLLVNYLLTGDGWLHEEAQIRFRERGAEDRLFFYDAETGTVLKPEKPVLGYLEYNVNNYCNLRCKGCSHFCNLIREPEFADIHRFREDLDRLKELFGQIEVIRLMGGEPFLNPDLGAFVSAARGAFPHAALNVVSNGLLIPKTKEEVLEVLRRNNAVVQVSNYPPTVRMGDAIRRKLEDCGVRYSISRPVLEFQYEVGGKAGDARKNYLHCPMIQDHLLSGEGRLCVCCNPVLYAENRDRLRTKRNVSDQDTVPLRGAGDGYEILRRLHESVPFCRYCLNRRKIMFPWKGNYLKELTKENLKD